MGSSLGSHRLFRRYLSAAAVALAALVAGSPPPRAGEPEPLPPLYRVEVIVFAHQAGRSDDRRVEELRGFGGAVDPLALAEAKRRAEEAAEEFARLYPPEAGDQAPGEPEELPEEPGQPAIEPLPPPYLAVEETSPQIARALQRLADSPAYRVLAHRAWYQPAESGARTPAIRVHDGTVIRASWPEGFDAEADETPAVRVFGDPVTEEFEGRETGAGMPAPEPVIEPELDYRTDGTVRLRRRQFLHLELDLEWREPDYSGFDRPLRFDSPFPSDESPPGHGEVFDDHHEGAWRVHRLVQSRVVRPGRLEYFDSAWLGVLVFFEAFEQPVPEPEPEPATDGTEEEPSPEPAPASGPL